MKVAVCDDCRENLNELDHMIRKYFKQKSDDTSEVADFTSATELIKKIKEEAFDVYFLDIIMPEHDGMEIGRIIRQSNPYAIIIYVTVSRDFAFEAFGVRAFHYLQKPVEFEKVSETMDMVEDLCRNKYDKKVCIHTKEGLVNVNMADIVYVENIARCAVYMMRDGKQVASVCNRSSFEKSVGVLNGQSGFIQPHKSYFVNMYYIRSFGVRNLTMEDGAQIAISRKRFVETKKKYLDFLSENGRIA